MGQRNERTRGLEADHISICKLTEDDSNWQIVLSRLEAIAEEIFTDRLSQRLPQTPWRDPREQPSDASLEHRMDALPKTPGSLK